MKTSTLITGTSELSLRFVPFVLGSSVANQLLFVPKEILGKVGTLVAVSLLALSPQLIYRSTEVHQYSTDVFASVVTTYLGFRLISTPTLNIL